MNIPNRQFELRQQPPLAIYLPIFFGTFFVSAAICMILSSVSRNFIGVFSFVFFPLGPAFLIAFVSDRLLPPCVINLEDNSFSIEVKRSSISIPLSKHTWTWTELSSFEFRAGGRSGDCLILEVNGACLTFREGKFLSWNNRELRELTKLLRYHFPEKEKKSIWSIF
jgi:hypothetical protein